MREMANLQSNNGETTAVVTSSKANPSTVSTTTSSSNTHIGPILSPVTMHGQQMVPPPVRSSAYRPYATGFMMPLNGREQPYGMPTSMMANLHNTTTVFADLVVSTFSLIQGSGSAVDNMGRINPPPGMGFSTQQMPNLTTNSAAILRQQMNESNQEMIHMLA